MTQWLKALAVLGENLGSVHSTWWLYSGLELSITPVPDTTYVSEPFSDL